MNLYKKFQQQFQLHPNKIVLTAPKEDVEFTFTEIQQNVGKVANALSYLGLKQGDRLAAILEKSSYNLFLYLACLQSGIIFLPLNISYSDEELAYFFQDFEPHVVVADPSRTESIKIFKTKPSLKFKTYALDAISQGNFRVLLDQQNSSFTTVESNPEDTAVVLYTSGTTGKPKGAMLSHGALLTNALTLNETWGITSQDVLLHTLPFFHVHGLFFACHTAFLSCAKIIFLDKFDVKAVLHYLPLATIFMGVPTYYTRLLSEPNFNKEITAHMRLFISGSAPLLESTFLECKEKTGYFILERYGMTETGINTSNPLEGERKSGTVGLPLPNVQVRITNTSDLTSENNKIGHIEIKGENLFKGYWRNPEKTAESFTKDGFFKTGDVGFFDKDGYLSIVGRSKDLIITGGLNVYPKEIELTLELHPKISESAVIGVPHADFGEAVVAVIVLKNSNDNISEQCLIDYLKKHHAGYKIPKKIFFTEFLPKNAMGKIQKNKLREQYSRLFFN